MNTRNNISLLVSAGSGPAECEFAVAHVLDRMVSEASVDGVELSVHSDKTKFGVKSALVVLHGDKSDQFSERWLGTIQWRCTSRIRPEHKRANWFVGVFLLGEFACKVSSEISQTDVRFESFRAGGPGGQHQNTTDSAIRAVHGPTGFTAVARDQRSQHRNKSVALARLQAMLDAQEGYKLESLKQRRNNMHRELQRGSPVRRFKGPNFIEVR